jgi:hypothetical protein
VEEGTGENKKKKKKNKKGRKEEKVSAEEIQKE